MSGFFGLAPGEMTSGAVYYLGSIFGSVGSVLAGSGTQLLPTMFKVFNTTVLSLGTMIISYTSVTGILLTAHEGEMLGKKLHGIWVPLRTVFGLSALLPSATGYSYLQIGLMWFIIQGIAAADTLWTTTASYLNAGGAIVPGGSAAAEAVDPDSQVRRNIGYIFQGLVCQAAMHYSQDGYSCHAAPDTTDTRSNFCKASQDELLNINNDSLQLDRSAYKMGENGQCGTLYTNNMGSLIGDAQHTVYQTIIPTLGAIAAQLVDIDYQYKSFVVQYKNYLNSNNTLPMPTIPAVVQHYCAYSPLGATYSSCNIINNFPTSDTENLVQNLYWPHELSPNYNDFITTAVNLYSGAIANAKVIEQMQNNQQNRTTGSIDSNNGWIYAGAYFMTLAKNNTRNASTSDAPNISTISDYSSIFPSDSSPNSLYIANSTNALLAAIDSSNQLLINNSITFGKGMLPDTGNKKVDRAMRDMRKAFQNCQTEFVDGFKNMLSSGGSMNPIVKASKFGQDLFAAIDLLYLLVFVAVVVMNSATITILGTGVPTYVTNLLSFLIPSVYALLAALFGFAATFAVYIPMVPYIIFSMGVINWLVATIEAMIAAPIIAIGLIYPEGNHDIWGRAEQSIMLLLNIFLRPSLMIFGFITAVMMTYVTMNYINATFLFAFNSVASVGINMSFVGWTFMISFVILYTGIFTAVINKCFDIIHIIPDKILRWVGGGHEQFGETGADRVGQKFDQGVQQMDVKGAEREGKSASSRHDGFIQSSADKKAQKDKMENPGSKTEGQSPGNDNPPAPPTDQ